MKRRRMLKHGTMAVTGMLMIAGCVSESDDGDSEVTPSEPQTETTQQAEGASTNESNMNSTESDADDESNTQSGADPTAQLAVDETVLEQHSLCTDTVVNFNQETGTVTVTGCVRGSNGCHEPILNAATIEESTLQVTIKSEDTSPENQVCTSVITENGYRLTVQMTDGLPATVTVTHDDIDGAETVLTTER